MRTMRGIAVGAGAVLHASLTLGAVYVVAPPGAGGNDANAGTAGAPFATIQRAANLVQPGDTVRVRAGTYAGFNVGTSGTAASPIVFVADPAVLVNTEAARFNGQLHHARINMDTVSWIVIDGFEVTGTNDLRTSKAGIRAVAPAGSTAGHITVRGCHVHHNGQWGIFTGHVNTMTVEGNLVHHTYDEHGVYLSNSGDGHVVRDNVIHSNGSQGLHVNADASQGGDGVITGVLVERNTIYNNSTGGTYIDAAGVTRTTAGGGSAINFDGVRDSTIRNNLLYDNHASGISLFRQDGLLPSSNNLVVNNTIVNGAPPGDANARWCVNISDASTGNVVFNNILLNYHPYRGSLIVTTDSLPGLVSDDNIVMDRIDPGTGTVGTLAQWRALTGNDAHSTALPAAAWPALFVGMAGHDYHLSASSAAKDAGAAAVGGRAAPPDDRDGKPRPAGAGYDLGAFELGCAADWNRDGEVNGNDISDYLNAWYADVQGGTAGADLNRDGETNGNDISDYINAWYAAVLGGGEC